MDVEVVREINLERARAVLRKNFAGTSFTARDALAAGRGRAGSLAPELQVPVASLMKRLSSNFGSKQAYSKMKGELELHKA